ncbi:MAG: hypothetical protein DRO18_05640 [Thermoprotei archaeon]|nr:MAG: hypothetical protein DRO18_05640 [Thermoprotei archaeon]
MVSTNIVASALKSGKLPAIFEEIADFLGVKDVTEAASRYLRLQILKNTVGEKWVRDIFSVFENPDILVSLPKPKALPYHPKHISEIFYATLQKTVESSAYLGEEIGSECISEMLSEGLSSALESNYNAALQTILNVWRGALPPDLSVAQALGMRIDTVETKYATSILAPTSALPYTILEALVQGANNRIAQLYTNLDQSVINTLTIKNTYLISHLEALGQYLQLIINELIFDSQYFVERLENYVNLACGVILERLTARLDDLEALEVRHNTTDPSTGTSLIDDETYEVMLMEIQADVNGLSNTFNNVKTEVNNLINDYFTVVDEILDDAVTTVVEYMQLFENTVNAIINNEINAINNLMTIDDMKSKIKELYERIRAYRSCGFDYS